MAGTYRRKWWDGVVRTDQAFFVRLPWEDGANTAYPCGPGPTIGLSRGQPWILRNSPRRCDGKHLPSYGILTANVPTWFWPGSSRKHSEYPPDTPTTCCSISRARFTQGRRLLTAVLFVIFGGKHEKVSTQATQAHRPMSAKEKRLAVVCVALAMWATDSFHQMNPAWVGLVIAILCLWPTFWPNAAKGAPDHHYLEPMVYVGGIIGLGALITHSGLAPRLANWALNFIPLAPDHPVTGFYHSFRNVRHPRSVLPQLSPACRL